jgi:hypothetical protein
MSVGLAASKTEVDARAGDICRAFQKSFTDVLTMKGYLDRTADADLVALGYTETEVTDLKTAWNDLYQLTTIWTGTAAQATPYDFRQFVQRIWGVGAF